jgi:hypothetical protein
MEGNSGPIRQPFKASQRIDVKQKITLFGRTINLPESRLLRIAAGYALIAGGIVGFLPVLGFWMIPLGILVLSREYHWARRLRRRWIVWRGNGRKKANGTGGSKVNTV